VLVAVLAKKRIFRELPIFVLYVACGFCGAVCALLAQSYFPHMYLSEWITETYVDTLIYFFALAELRVRLKRYNQVAASGWSFVALLFVFNIVLLKSLSRWVVPVHFPSEWRFAVHSLQATAVLELAGLLALVEWGMVLRFRWPDRELRIVTGFGFSGVVTMTAAILFSHPSIFSGPAFHWVDLLNSTVDLGVLIYWLWYFLFEDGGLMESAAARSKAMGVSRWTGRSGEDYLTTVHATRTQGSVPQ